MTGSSIQTTSDIVRQNLCILIQQGQHIQSLYTMHFSPFLEVESEKLLCSYGYSF